MDLDEVVALSVKHNAADLHLCSGHLPHWRRQGVLEPIPQQTALDGDWLETFMQQWLSGVQQDELEASGHLDFAITLQSGVRLRANLFMQRHGLSLALRLIASQAPDIDQLQLPDVVQQLLQLEEGLILITGATGSGKSTTLASLVDCLNREQARHIITLEDPIEFVHHSQRSLIQQREVGAHTASFQHGLKAALREDPDVILLGELRDSETIRLALTAAETGHLVLATLHTRGATQAVDRLVDVFPAEEKNLVRTQLAGSLKAVLAQRLVPAKNGGRIGLFEVLVATPAVVNLIREGKMHQLPGVLQTGAQAGMQTFAQSEQARQQAGLI
ncbi:MULTISPECIES: type IV pilus twitching motility protein PilT [unclassified Pantoea]|uniref:type IV pilus twitching motility protein PilT n=1 Tax=unclassified Pantoea TaxID=2630326 RepID=UPI001CD786A9|nr:MULTISPECIES: type IV pilus twitching motility protein PilT [unclassified Pantoea]MCA1178244.1 type IV pilus twitching motility protein PilT [Pantoea sp. alder69]MCA1251904.1 type IV pilus twitching motility protein PilT [Pantoea sp. alder70]MCA1266660.1 type IV pilus twitching motility protein PilT [Pantoea sp. alder81]